MDVHVYLFGLCGRLPWGDDDVLPAGEVESGKKLCVVPGGKKGTEEQHMGHASHILCMAISSDGKYLVRGQGTGVAVWDRELAVEGASLLQSWGEVSYASMYFAG